MNETLEEYFAKVAETEINFYSKEELLKGDPNYDYCSFPQWIIDSANYFNKLVFIEDKLYILRGIQSTFEDYYYLAEDIKTGKVIAHTCVAKMFPTKVNFIKK